MESRPLGEGLRWQVAAYHLLGRQAIEHVSIAPSAGRQPGGSCPRGPRQSFSFESVLSDPSKLREIEVAKAAGCRIYLYFVCTENADIKVARVANRTRLGGHTVPEIRIRERYARILANLPEVFPPLGPGLPLRHLG